MEDDIYKIHKASIKILEVVGFEVNKTEIVEVLEKNGIKIVDGIAFFTEDQIMSNLAKVPKSFTIFARNPKYNMLIDRENTQFAAGYGCTSIIDKNNTKREATYDDFIKFVKLVHSNDFFNINGGILVQPCDLETNISIPLMMYTTMVHSDKCLMGISGYEKEVNRIMEMASILFGGEEDFCSKPHLLTLVNTASPLKLGNFGADTILVCAKYKQPMIITAGPIGGATGPVTIAGNLAIGNAEILATIAITQLLCPGIPIIYGLNSGAFNMSSGAFSIGSPVCTKQMIYSSRLAKYYNLPNRCGGPLTDAKNVGVQSGYESMMTLLSTMQEGASFILHSAGILDSYASMSYEKFIADIEMISMVKYLIGDLDVSDSALSVEEICNIGIGGEFLTSEHTFNNFRSSSWIPEIGINSLLEKEVDPQALYESNIKQMLDKMLNGYIIPDIDIEVLNKLNRYLVYEIGVNENYINI